MLMAFIIVMEKGLIVQIHHLKYGVRRVIQYHNKFPILLVVLGCFWIYWVKPLLNQQRCMVSMMYWKKASTKE